MRRAFVVMLGAACLSVVVLASTTVGQDTFTEGGSSVALSAHTPDTGTSWAEVVDTGTNTATVNNSFDYLILTAASASAHLIYTFTPNPALSSADYDVSITLLALATGATDNDPVFLIGRYADSNNFYAFGVDGDSTNGRTYAILERVGGTDALLTTGSITLAANDVLKFSLRGDTLKIYQNGVQLDCVVDASLSAAGDAGLAWGNLGGAVWAGNTADPSTGWQLDNWLLDDFTGEGGDDNCAAPSGGAPRMLLLGVGAPR